MRRMVYLFPGNLGIVVERPLSLCVSVDIYDALGRFVDCECVCVCLAVFIWYAQAHGTIFHVSFRFSSLFTVAFDCFFIVHSKWETNSDFVCVIEMPLNRIVYNAIHMWSHIIFRSRLKIECRIQGKAQANFLWIWICEFATRNVSHSPKKKTIGMHWKSPVVFFLVCFCRLCCQGFHLVASTSTSIVLQITLVFGLVFQHDWSP